MAQGKKQANPMTKVRKPLYGKAMKQYRNENDISQPALAKLMDERQQLISNVETGRTKLNIEFANKFKKVTGVDLLNIPSGNESSNSKQKINDSESLLDVNQTLRDKIRTQEKVIGDLKSTNEELSLYIQKLESKLNIYG